MKAYYVRRVDTREILNQQGTWSRDFGSYRLAEYETQEAATAAFPEGVACVVVEREKKGGRS